MAQATETKRKTGQTTKQLRELADHLFVKKGSLVSLQQEIAENFYPERRTSRSSATWATTSPEI